MQTIKDVAPKEDIQREFLALSGPELMAVVIQLADYYQQKLIDQEVHDYLLFNVMEILQVPGKVVG